MFVTSRGSEPMRRVDTVRAVPGGLEGDRYLDHLGYWSPLGDECEVTMIEGEALDEIESRHGVSVGSGEHRRNLVTRGVVLRGLSGKRFRVGDALMEYDRPRPPCRYVESITEAGMTRALAARRGGICVRVLEEGIVRVGDAIQVVGEIRARGIRGLLRR